MDEASAEATVPRDLKRPTISHSATEQVLPRVAPAPTAKRDSRANAPRNAGSGGEQRSNERERVSREGVCGFCSHFAGEKIACLFMPRNSPAVGSARTS